MELEHEQPMGGPQGLWGWRKTPRPAWRPAGFPEEEARVLKVEQVVLSTKSLGKGLHTHPFVPSEKKRVEPRFLVGEQGRPLGQIEEWARRARRPRGCWEDRGLGGLCSESLGATKGSTQCELCSGTSTLRPVRVGGLGFGSPVERGCPRGHGR